MLDSFLGAPRPVKRLISIVYDMAAITSALYIAFSFRLGAAYEFNLNEDVFNYGLTTLVSIITFIKLGLYRAVLRYMTYQAIYTVALGVLISSIALIANSFFLGSYLPRSVPVIYIFCALILIGLPRLTLRSIVHLSEINNSEKVIIYGAGVSGSQLAAALQHTAEYQPVAFLDDNKKLHNSSIRGLDVYPSKELEALLSRYGTDKILLALGRAPRAARHKVVRSLEHHPVQILTVPNVTEILSGEAKVNDLKDIEIEDLLGRDPSVPDHKLMKANIQNKVVLVTGAGGSIGSELCRQILKLGPKKLLLLELNEFNLYKVDSSLHRDSELLTDKPVICSILGSAEDFELVKHTLQSHHVNTIYHAAAYKHVPLVEGNMVAGLRNNVLSTWHTAKAAAETQVSTFVLISSDKAVHPSNVMGATKRIAELVLQGLDQHQNTTRFSMVRFGNVLGSSGSVVPKFKQQIADGGPITVTHPDITRYFMVTSEAVQLVIQAGAMASGGDVYVLDMGEPVKINDLAKEMILLSGLTIKDAGNPDGDVAIEYTGLRPGEKLYEELLVDENCYQTRHPCISRAKEVHLSWEDTLNLIESIKQLDFDATSADIFNILNTNTVFYRPSSNSSMKNNVHPINDNIQVAQTAS